MLLRYGLIVEYFWIFKIIYLIFIVIFIGRNKIDRKNCLNRLIKVRGICKYMICNKNIMFCKKWYEFVSFELIISIIFLFGVNYFYNIMMIYLFDSVGLFSLVYINKCKICCYLYRFYCFDMVIFYIYWCL